MNRIDGYYLFTVGMQIHPLSALHSETPWADAHIALLVAEGALAPFLDQSVFKPEMCRHSGRQLLDIIRQYKVTAEQSYGKNEERNGIGVGTAYFITNALNNFEAVLAAELGLANIYLVGEKGGFKIKELIDMPDRIFPADLFAKVPASKIDIEQATKCLAYELPTACGFHLHRANESVLKRYYDEVTDGASRPKNRNIGEFLKELDNRNCGDDKLKACLKSINSLHRNPLIHPEDSLESVEEAIALLGIIRSSITMMLKAIPTPSSAVTYGVLSGALTL